MSLQTHKGGHSASCREHGDGLSIPHLPSRKHRRESSPELKAVDSEFRNWIAGLLNRCRTAIDNFERTWPERSLGALWPAMQMWLQAISTYLRGMIWRTPVLSEHTPNVSWVDPGT